MDVTPPPAIKNSPLLRQHIAIVPLLGLAILFAQWLGLTSSKGLIFIHD